MTVKTENQQGVIAWHLPAKNLIKLQGQETTKLSDTVAKLKLEAGDKVTYQITDGIITSLVPELKLKKEEPKVETPVVEQPKVEETQTSEPSMSQEMTVWSVSANRKVMKFASSFEESKQVPWVNISDEIQAKDYKDIGLVGKGKVRATIINNTLVAVEAIQASQDTQSTPKDAESTTSAVEAPKSEPKTEYTSYKRSENSSVQTSIEAQASVNSACNIVGQMVASLPEKPPASKINEFIKAIAESNYALIQELKSK